MPIEIIPWGVYNIDTKEVIKMKYLITVFGGALLTEQCFKSNDCNPKNHIRATGADRCEVYLLSSGEQIAAAVRKIAGEIINEAF